MTATLPPDYAAHDAIYRRLRASGAAGWGSDQEISELFERVQPWLAGLPVPARLLELGCGAGNLSLLLAARGDRVTGVDIAPTAVHWARERAEAAALAADFQVGDVVTLAPFGDKVFDAVVDGHCLHCIIGADRARCLEAVHRVLRPGGIFIVATMCGQVLDKRILSQFDAQTSTVVTAGRPTRTIGQADELVAEIARAGFDMVSVQVQPRRHASDQDELLVLAAKGAGAAPAQRSPRPGLRRGWP